MCGGGREGEMRMKNFLFILLKLIKETKNQKETDNKTVDIQKRKENLPIGMLVPDSVLGTERPMISEQGQLQHFFLFYIILG